MKILFLGDNNSPLIGYLRNLGDEVRVETEPLVVKTLREYDPDWIISYGYRHILKKEILGLYPERYINLHIAYLPWNRGADPNLWSWVEDTPKGVTIHYIDSGVDTGDIITQKEVIFTGKETLASSYAKLRTAMDNLFREIWPQIRAGATPRQKQIGVGSCHRVADRAKVEHLLTAGWKTRVKNLRSVNTN
ncbi:MAG: formyltransferase family protein [Patescibacteria group bacterium]